MLLLTEHVLFLGLFRIIVISSFNKTLIGIKNMNGYLLKIRLSFGCYDVSHEFVNASLYAAHLSLNSNYL